MAISPLGSFIAVSPEDVPPSSLPRYQPETQEARNSQIPHYYAGSVMVPDHSIRKNHHK